MKKLFLLLFLSFCALFLTGCSALSQNPLQKIETTSIPGLNMQLHAASASQDNVDEIKATLYFRYLDQPFLVGEPRMLTVRRDESTEMAIIKALLEGPSAGHNDLRRIFPETVQIESVSSRDSILYVTFNEALLTDDDIPTDWQQQEQWISEAPLLRRLIIQSIVASITESFPYTGIQVLIHRPSIVEASLRLDNSYFLNTWTGLSDPQTRTETFLLTPRNCALSIMDAWQRQDFESLYLYIANSDKGENKPSQLEVQQQLDAYPALSSFSVSSGNVSSDGQRCVISASFSVQKNGEILPVIHYPLPLIRENEVWKITYPQLLAAMGQAEMSE